MLNRFDNDYYLCYCKHNPMTNVITSNSTACLQKKYTVMIPYQIRYIIDIYW